MAQTVVTCSNGALRTISTDKLTKAIRDNTKRMLRGNKRMKKIGDLAVRMRDGATLVCDAYLPELGPEGSAPTVLERTPYGRTKEFFSTLAERLTESGYVYVVQDVRGRGDSDGTFELMMNPKHEGWDGAATVDWLTAQDWWNGYFATIGGSFSAANQQALALEQPRGYMGQVLRDCGTNYYQRMFRQHGACNIGVIFCWIVSQAHLDNELKIDANALSQLQAFRAHRDKWVDALPLDRDTEPFRSAPQYQSIYFRILEHGNDGPFWKNPLIRLEDNWAKYPASLACLNVTGWFAHHCQANIDKWEHMAELSPDRTRLIIGPWTHSYMMLEDTVAGDVDFGPEAGRYGPWQDAWLDWLDLSFGRQPVGRSSVCEEGPISFFLMGGGDGHMTEEGHIYHGGRWLQTDVWPPSDAAESSMYLQANGELTEKPQEGDTPPSEFTFDPADPCPGLGSVSLQYTGSPEFVRPGPQNQKCDLGFGACRGSTDWLRNRTDVLCFETGQLVEDMVVAGPVQVLLYASTSASDTDFVARLIDVFPPSADFPEGYEMLVSDGIQRMRFLRDLGFEELVEPYKVYEVQIELGPTANIFQRGHKLRLDVTSSSFPQYDVNPNTGRQLGDYSRLMDARQRIYHDGVHQSVVKLWRLPEGAACT